MAKRIQPSNQMDDETFVKHFNARHMPMAGMNQLHESILTQSPIVLQSFRNFHKWVHRWSRDHTLPTTYTQPNHYHGKAK